MRDKYSKSLNEYKITNTDIDVLKSRCSSFETTIEHLKNDVATYQLNYSVLCDEISSVLSDDFVKVEPNLKDIKEKIQLLMASSKSRGNVILKTLKYF